MGPLEMRLPNRGATQYTDLSGWKILFLAEPQACFDTLFKPLCVTVLSAKEKGNVLIYPV